MPSIKRIAKINQCLLTDAKQTFLRSVEIRNEKHNSGECEDKRHLRWPRSFEQNFGVVKWIVGRGYAAVRSGSGSK
jgi:hypothetical protein